jgi:ABC-type transporter Mla subunit MlaD
MVPTWLWVVLAALASISYLSWRLDSVKADRALVAAERDTANTRVTSLGNTLRLQRQITDDINRVSDDAKAKTEHVTAAVAIADGRARSLQQQITNLLATRKSCAAEVASGSKARADLTVLLADLRRMADETAGSLAAALDRSRIAGFACEAAYSAAQKNR